MADYKAKKDAMAKQAAIDEAARKKKIEGQSDEENAKQLSETKEITHEEIDEKTANLAKFFKKKK
jgi:hypothetical protein